MAFLELLAAFFSRKMDGARGDVRLHSGQALPEDAEGPHPAPHHPESGGGRRIS